jgi:hypothetical protein
MAELIINCLCSLCLQCFIRAPPPDEYITNSPLSSTHTAPCPPSRKESLHSVDLETGADKSVDSDPCISKYGGPRVI